MIGRIYFIKYLDYCYVGSTICSIEKRFSEHLRNCNNPKSRCYNNKLYTKMRELGVENWKIELYKEFECDNIQELKKKEGEAIREFSTNLNSYIAGRTMRDYYLENKQSIYEKHRLYIKNNWEKRQKYLKAYYKNRRELLKCHL